MEEIKHSEKENRNLELIKQSVCFAVHRDIDTREIIISVEDYHCQMLSMTEEEVRKFIIL